MNRKKYDNTSLTCIFQSTNPFDAESPSTLNPQPSTVLAGIISRTPEGFRFEEAIRKGRAPRNPKLFDGNYLSMVRMQNGRYQLHLKTMSEVLDHEKYAFGVYSEVINALKIIE